ncbi:MAG: tail protein X [Thomasclavelia ramosa]|nr:tail protein X [Thomasclavelia ramosa]
MKTFALQGDTLDAICVRYYGLKLSICGSNA